ncbi:MAG: hypothetical protein ACYC4D_02675 [Thermoleophilia bacterium]
MRKRFIIHLALMACVTVAFGIILSNEISQPEQASAAGNSLSLNENASNGHITVETDSIKAVWHYKTLASEAFNQGGGNLYELYYKPMDPDSRRNLVSTATYGNERSTPIWAGIGGVGATDLYASDIQPGLSQTNSFNDLIGDNNPSGVLESHAAKIDGQGNAVLSFTYRVHNQSTGKDWYRVTKNWTLEPGGAIHLKVDWSLLASGYFSEMAVRSNWNYNVGWTRFSKYGRDWLATDEQRYLLGSSIEGETAECWDNLNRFHPDWVALTGSSAVPGVKMTAVNNGQGFRGGGSYQLGLETWGSAANPIEEQCSLLGGVTGAHVINWMAWWSGNPPAGNRYHWLGAGTAWSDSYRIDLSQNSPGGGPDISSVVETGIGSGSSRVSWSTDTDSDSVVEVSQSNGVWVVAGSDANRTRSHSVVTSNLTPGRSYSFRVKSRDAGGNLSVSSGYELNASGSFDTRIILAQNSAGWRNYADYLNRLLTVDFTVSNQGTSVVNSANIVSVSASSGVGVNSSLPIALGNIATGSSANFTVTYVVSYETMAFRTRITGNGVGSGGELIDFATS